MVVALKPKLTRAVEMYGYVHAFDHLGNQMPKYQGAFTEVRAKIEREGVVIERRGLAQMKGN